MKTTSRPRLVVLVFALLALPALTCGVAPALRDLMLRMQRVESYLATVQLPPLLVDSAGNVVGPVLEYNRLFTYSSVDLAYRDATRLWQVRASANADASALATVLFTPAGEEASLVLEANRDELLTLAHSFPASFYFESQDCSGTPWVPVFSGNANNSVYRRVWIAPPGRTLYTADLDGPLEDPVMHSYVRVAGWNDVDPTYPVGLGTEGPCERTNTMGPRDRRWRPMRPVADLDALFTPPFRLIAQGPMATAP